MSYDSANDTIEHIGAVRRRLDECLKNISERSVRHDQAKLNDPEKPYFDEYTPKLKDSTYGSDEYKQFLVELKPALDHHYETYDHHPEHFENGINGMSLMALIEMLCDWKAAGERHDDGSMAKSLHINQERFHIEPQLQKILTNTAKELGWL